MASDQSSGTLLEKAEAQESKYNWFEAAKHYEHLLSSKSKTPLSEAETWERIGRCYAHASTQAENSEDFKRNRQLADNAYVSAAKLYEKEDDLKNQGKSAHCYALAEYTRSWLASTPSEKREMLDKCRLLGEKSLKAYEKAGEWLSYGKACNDLLLCLFERLYVAADWKEMTKIAQEGIDRADTAVKVLLKLGDKSELLRALSTASLQSWQAHSCVTNRQEIIQRSLSFSQKALKLSREVDDLYNAAMAEWSAALGSLLFTEKVESASKYAQDMLQHGTVVKDNYLKGVASYVLTFIIDWTMAREEDPDKKKKAYEEIIKHAEDAIRCLRVVSKDFFIAETSLFYAEAYSSLARDVATSPNEKRRLLEKAVEIGRRGLQHATRSGSLDATGSTLHALSKALHFCSNFEAGKDEKTRLIEEALTHREEYVRITERAFPSHDWVIGVGKSYEGLIKADLARLETNTNKKKVVLESAVSNLEEGLTHCRKWISSRPVPTTVATVGRFEDSFGGMLNELFLLTEDKKTLNRAIETYRNASERFKEVNLPSCVAEAYWKIARNNDLLGEHQQAATDFENAFAAYKVTAQKIVHFADFYLDYANYMKAWSEIERAKIAHKNRDYDTAIKHYEKTANLLNQSKLWSYLASNFLAWSVLEQAEDSSRRENSVNSIEAFKNTVELFHEAKANLRTNLDKIENADEKDLAERLVKASETREKYCLGRIAIEEAKMLDRKGDHAASSEKYGSAAETFQSIAKIESDQTQQELQSLTYLCQAWEKMMMAEAKASAIMYEEAAELFIQAREHAPDQPTSLMALAHSSFCKALEAGTEFEVTRDVSVYSTIRKHMETAANYYLKAGFKTASEYAKATQRLFDAYIYMENAKRETDPEKEAKYYTMAEKLLETATASYQEAKHPEKTEQVQRVLKEVKEEKEMALSLSEILHAPTITSSTASFLTLTPREERAVGLERFEHADVQARLIQHEKEIRIGEELALEVQIVNVGREAVLLTKIEEILPAGFQIAGKPDYCEIQDTHLDMKGKRLDPLKTEEVKLVLKPFSKGTFEIMPKITCVDENGNQLLRGLDPAKIDVLEVVLPNRIATGYKDLDGLMFGGLPENYAVVLTSPSCDERDLLIKRFIEAGVKEGQITFYVTVEAGWLKSLAKEFQSNFYLFICNPRADLMVENLPNVFKLKGIENLTDIGIAFASAFRKLDTSTSAQKRACIEIVSDVLLQHQAISTRRWLTGLLPDLRSRGFTSLAVVNPLMHPPQDVHAILGLFEGEISINERETKRGFEKFLKIRKLYNQRYIEDELVLRKESLENAREDKT